MKKIIQSLSEAMKELNIIEQIELDLMFVKKQAFAYQLQEVMIKSGF